MNAKQRVIYEVEMERLTFHVYLLEIYDIIGDEPLVNDEVYCLANIGSNQTITLSWGAKKKLSTHSEGLMLAENLHVGDIVVVSNYGTHWQHRAQIVSIDIENNTTNIKWDTAQRRDTVELTDWTKYTMNDIGLRKRKLTIFLFHYQIKKLLQSDHWSMI
jgi:hypothetical protein